MTHSSKVLIVCFGLMLFFATSTPLVFVEVDRTRDHTQEVIEDRYFLPNPMVTKALSLGHQTMMADVLWVRTILIFSDFAYGCNPQHAQWLLSMIKTIANLDPKWRTLYFYGGTMMNLCQDVEAADELFKVAHVELPDDYFFPFSLAMNAYLVHRDYEAAERWMREAAGKKGAPNWYKAAVAGLINKQGQRQTSIRYLRDELKKDLPPAVRASSEERLRLLQHEEYSEALEVLRQEREQVLGRPVQTLDDLSTSYPDPWNEGWLLAPDGQIRSVEMERREQKRTRDQERAMLRNL